MTVPNNQAFNQSTHLSNANVAIDDAKSPAALQIKIKQSKTDSPRRGVDLYVVKPLCSISYMYAGLPQHEGNVSRTSVSICRGSGTVTTIICGGSM